ncbi:unnamed protein product [Heligmosomoides polygyrus]|uniref:SMC hinge domain-containing protein n=1 Tax=Heligmosomoides polygyrus TaxID=6339 RepID=A0A183FEQ7_HELPZ|nr:unnamed protein product [Heligmosomoides polygyrus]
MNWMRMNGLGQGGFRQLLTGNPTVAKADLCPAFTAVVAIFGYDYGEKIVLDCKQVRLLPLYEFRKQSSARIAVDDKCGTIGPTAVS